MTTADRAAGSAPIRVLVVDDHPVVRQGLKLLLSQESDMAVCAEAGSAREALRQVQEAAPDVVVADISLRDESGLELVKSLKIRHPQIPVLVLSIHDETLYAERMLRAGARGYVMKEAPPEQVVTAIRRVRAGQIAVSEAMSARLLEKLIGGGVEPSDSPIDCLTDRELQVFGLIGKGLSTRRIAERLHLSVKTIEAHRANIKRKLNLPDAMALVRQAFDWAQYGESRED